MKFILILVFVSFIVGIKAQSTTTIPGGRVDVDLQRKDVLEAANFAFLSGVKSIESQFAYKLVKLIRAQSQVVAGIKFYLAFAVAETICPKGTQVVDDECRTIRIQVCEAVVLVREWLESEQRELLSFSCFPE